MDLYTRLSHGCHAYLVAFAGACCPFVFNLSFPSTARYLATARSLEVDVHITEDLRSMLFVNPGKVTGLDLSVFNIQRGRDHGLPDYNSMREAYGLSRRA